MWPVSWRTRPSDIDVPSTGSGCAANRSRLPELQSSVRTLACGFRGQDPDAIACFRFDLAKREVELDRDEHRDGFAPSSAGPESPLPGGLDRLQIQAERRVERPEDLDVPDAAVPVDDAPEKHRALQARPHGV